MPTTKKITKDPTRVNKAKQILEEAPAITVASAAPAFDAEARGEGRVPALYLSTLGGNRRVTDIETINQNTFRVFTRTHSLMLGELNVYQMFGGHPLINESEAF